MILVRVAVVLAVTAVLAAAPPGCVETTNFEPDDAGVDADDPGDAGDAG